jgi:hypothetical protein
LLAVPLFERHTETAIAELLSRALSTLCPQDWKKKQIGISTDRAANLTGRLSGVVTLLTADTFPGIFRIWCGAHQLDLVIQNLMSSLCGDEFYTLLTGLIGHLRRQQNLIVEMPSTWPAVASTRWLSFGKVCKWLTSNRLGVLEHLETKSPTCKPAQYWCIVLLAVNAFMEPVDICFRKIQGLSTLICEQKEAPWRLVLALQVSFLLRAPSGH